MSRWTRWLSVIVASLALALAARRGAGQDDKPVIVNWSATDTSGHEVKIPGEKPAVLLFVRADHPSSKQAIEQIKGLAGSDTMTVVAIFSGKQAGDQAAATGALPWPVVLDPDYAASGKLNVHVWPTTLVIKSDGQQVAHVGGMPEAYGASVEAYLQFASGKIDQAALKQRLEVHEVITDSPKAKAQRRLQVAKRLLAGGQAAQARAELEEGLKLSPEDGGLHMAMAQALLALNQPQEAIRVLDGTEGGAVPAWQIQLLRGKGLIALGQWEQAKAVLPEAMKLNPSPAEALYLMGQVYQHENDLAHAVEAFRKAYESATTAATRP